MLNGFPDDQTTKGIRHFIRCNLPFQSHLLYPFSELELDNATQMTMLSAVLTQRCELSRQISDEAAAQVHDIANRLVQQCPKGMALAPAALRFKGYRSVD